MALLVVSVTLGLVIQRSVLLGRLADEVNDGLVQELDELRALATSVDPATGAPRFTDARALFDAFFATNVPGEGEAFLAFVDGEFYAGTVAPARLERDPDLAPRWANLRDPDSGQAGTEAGPVRYIATPVGDVEAGAASFVAANFLRQEQQEIDQMTAVAAAVSVALLLLASGAAWLVAGRVLRPLRSLAATAHRISETDLTERLPAEGRDELAELSRTFNEMLDRLDTAFAGQRAFLDDAGHELRTPITIVRGHLETMGPDEASRAEAMAIVEDELDRMSRLVDDLLVLARAGQPDFVRPEILRLADIVDDVHRKCATAWPQRSWIVEAVADGEVVGDRQRLEQALLNLARNAAQHTGPGQRVWLGSGISGSDGCIWVRDEGSGVAPEERERIFERFRRGAQSRHDGSGLGLSIVSAIAAAHHGRVELASPPGRGATFTLVVPLAPEVHP